jgi:hypothetical protein
MALLNVVILCLQALVTLHLNMTSEVATGKAKITVYVYLYSVKTYATI